MAQNTHTPIWIIDIQLRRQFQEHFVQNIIFIHRLTSLGWLTDKVEERTLKRRKNAIDHAGRRRTTKSGSSGSTISRFLYGSCTQKCITHFVSNFPEKSKILLQLLPNRTTPSTHSKLKLWFKGKGSDYDDNRCRKSV
jgi:hypothetical protein